MENLLSVDQNRILKKSIEILVSVGVLPHLPKGIGVAIEKRCASFNMLKINITSVQVRINVC